MNQNDLSEKKNLLRWRDGHEDNKDKLQTVIEHEEPTKCSPVKNHKENRETSSRIKRKPQFGEQRGWLLGYSENNVKVTKCKETGDKKIIVDSRITMMDSEFQDQQMIGNQSHNQTQQFQQNEKVEDFEESPGKNDNTRPQTTVDNILQTTGETDENLQTTTFDEVVGSVKLGQTMPLPKERNNLVNTNNRKAQNQT